MAGDIYTRHMEECSDHTRLLERARHPDSPGGTVVTPEEIEHAIRHARQVVQRGAVEGVLIRKAQHNMEVRGLQVMFEAEFPLEKNLWFSVKHFFGLVRNTKKEAPSRAANSAGLERKSAG